MSAKKLLTLLLALPLGLLISFGRMAKFRVLRFLTQFYISVMRGTPLMLQLLVVYYGPYFIFGIRITNEYRFIAVIIGFVLGGLAYSGVTPTNSAFCRAYFGPAHYPVNFPLINSNLIFASFGSTISGALYDASGSYNATFFLIIGLAAAGILCSLAISAIDKKSK